MVGRLLLRPRPLVDAGSFQSVRRLWRAEKMVEPESEIALPASGGIVPEGVELFLPRMQCAQGVRPALVEDPSVRLARRRLADGIVGGRADRENVAVLRNHVPVAAQHGRTLVLEKL